jgi:hypothetical protein
MNLYVEDLLVDYSARADSKTEISTHSLLQISFNSQQLLISLLSSYRKNGILSLSRSLFLSLECTYWTSTMRLIDCRQLSALRSALYDMYPSVTKVWSVVARSVSWRRVQRRFVGISSMPSEGDVQAAVRQKAAQTKSRRWMRAWACRVFSRPRCLPRYASPFPTWLTNVFRPGRHWRSSQLGGRGFIYLFISLKFLK